MCARLQARHSVGSARVTAACLSRYDAYPMWFDDFFPATAMYLPTHLQGGVLSTSLATSPSDDAGALGRQGTTAIALWSILVFKKSM